MQTQMLGDATWAGLDPRAGAFTRRESRRAVMAVLAAVFVVAVVWAVWWSGALSPRITFEPVPDGAPGGAIGTTRSFTYQVMLVNRAPGAVTIRSAGRSGPGLKLLSVTGANATLPGSSSTRVELTYEVTDCGLVPHEDWPIPVTVQRRYGPDVLMISPPPIDPFWLDDQGVEPSEIEDDPFGDTSSFDGTTSDDLGEQPWQGVLARQVCTSPDRTDDE